MLNIYLLKALKSIKLLVLDMYINLPTKFVQYKRLAFLVLLILIGSISTSLASFYTVAVSIKLEDPNAVPGSVVSYIDGEYVLTSQEYDNLMYGVLVEDPNLSLVDLDIPNSKLLVSSGEAPVLASNANGDIKKGDYLTSSSTPGIAMKADKTGQILGLALEDLVLLDGQSSGKVNTLLDVKAAFVGNTSVRTNLLQTLRSGISSPFLTPIDSLRYTLSAIIVGATFLLGFASFGRTSGNSLHALGRNPLASKEIRTALLFNFVLTFIVMAIGFGISYLMLIY